jgi:uncharacterized protein YbjT (DUF2867 family)
MLAITAATGKIGGAVLDSLLSLNLESASNIVVLTSSPLDSPKVEAIRRRGVHEVRQANYSDRTAVAKALAGCDRFFLVSTPEIHLDFNDAPLGKGREGRHFNAIDAAIDAGVKQIYYTSLAFREGSGAGVMRAHFRTEDYLHQHRSSISYTIIREGLYTESWPLYLGHFAPNDKRKEMVVAGDGKLSWTSIADLGRATARIITSGQYDDNQIVTLSQKETKTLDAIARSLGRSIKVVSSEEYVRHYRDEHGMDEAFLQWWVTTYPSVSAGLCHIEDSPLESLLPKAPEPFATDSF